jgi:hypothetical protein
MISIMHNIHTYTSHTYAHNYRNNRWTWKAYQGWELESKVQEKVIG